MSKQNYPFQAKLVNRYKEVSTAAVLATANRIKVWQLTSNHQALVCIPTPKSTEVVFTGRHKTTETSRENKV